MGYTSHMEALREPGMIHVKVMCIITRGGKMLATKGFDGVKGETFYRLIGGGVHFCEQALDALKREVREELETEVEHVTFRELVQNIFTYNGTPGHELTFVYSADLVRTELYEKEEIPIADHPSVIASWIPTSDVVSGTLTVYPTIDYSFLETA
jgi:8-oxo-dGTP pyrophosphatase MutT (NUDIX family)